MRTRCKLSLGRSPANMGVSVQNESLKIQGRPSHQAAVGVDYPYESG